ncbi:CLUMA_CG016109, isoform A [Clunio marinus]|uniref:CLUMA_CG016109, isoform A n=1 Tax=Clunio marinus TaxID=568069 RepID=A0A1J1IW70_9DIPT|nr:CLUMA_CG016109, isoform A [Clunio marinus]
MKAESLEQQSMLHFSGSFPTYYVLSLDHRCLIQTKKTFQRTIELSVATHKLPPLSYSTDHEIVV